MINWVAMKSLAGNHVETRLCIVLQVQYRSGGMLPGVCLEIGVETLAGKLWNG